MDVETRAQSPPTQALPETHGLEDCVCPIFLPLSCWLPAGQEAPSDQAWRAAQWAFGHCLNSLWGWEAMEHWTWKGPQRSDGQALPFSGFGDVWGSSFDSWRHAGTGMLSPILLDLPAIGLLDCCFSHIHLTWFCPLRMQNQSVPSYVLPPKLGKASNLGCCVLHCVNL